MPAPTPPRSPRPAPPPMSGPGAAPPMATASKPRPIAVRTPGPLCPRMVFYAAEKFGKTTFAAFAPDPVVLMASGEAGYDTLLSAGLVPAVPATIAESWPDTLGLLDGLIADQQGRKAVVLDAIGGFERLCQEHVCASHFDGEWGEQGFAGYGKGLDRTAGEWLQLLQRLEQLHARGVVTVLIGHAKVRIFNDPLGPAYDRYQCDAHEKVWASIARWSDCIFFGKFHTIVETGKQGAKKSIAERKGKAIGGTERVVHTVGCDAFVAGNRYGMPAAIDLPNDDHTAGWRTVWETIVGVPE